MGDEAGGAAAKMVDGWRWVLVAHLPRGPGRGGGLRWRRRQGREREMPGPKGNGSDLGILIPSLICKLYTLALLLLFFLHKKVLSLL